MITMSMRHLYVSAVVVSLSVACGFPNVMYRPGADGSAEEDASTADGDVTMMDGASVDTGLPDAGPDAKPPVEGGTPCDKDNDTYKAESCGGNDCDDTDLRANKGVMSWKYFPPVEPTFGDWDCSHTVEAEVTTFNLKCDAYLTLTTNCAALSGYTGPGPACGGFGTWVTCKAGLTNCAIDKMVMKQQGCR